MRDRSRALVADLPDGLLDALRAGGVRTPNRADELARVRERLATVSLDDDRVLGEIATKLLLVSSGG